MTPDDLTKLHAAWMAAPHWDHQQGDIYAKALYDLAPLLIDLWRAAEHEFMFLDDCTEGVAMALAALRAVQQPNKET